MRNSVVALSFSAISPYPTTAATLLTTAAAAATTTTTSPSNSIITPSPSPSPSSLAKSRSLDQLPHISCSRSSSSSLKSGGICRASQAVELFPPVCPEIVVREARLEDWWEVAETHCSSFFPNYSFPLDLALRIDRLVGLLSGFSIPIGCRRTCLVAVVEDNKLFFTNQPGGFSKRRYVAGILTVDTVADFLPRKGPLRQRRTGIAYVSNVAVRERDRCKGIAKRLVLKAEAQARSWGCRAIALHCDVNNPAATQLYRGQGFKSIKVPERANWPQPKTAPDVHFSFMMKLLTTCSPSSREKSSTLD